MAVKVGDIVYVPSLGRQCIVRDINLTRFEINVEYEMAGMIHYAWVGASEVEPIHKSESKFKVGDDVEIMQTQGYLARYIGTIGVVEIAGDPVGDERLCLVRCFDNESWWFFEDKLRNKLDYALTPGDLSGLLNNKLEVT